MTKFRNYNQGRVKELIENALREATSKIQAFNIGEPTKFKEFDELPEKNIFDDSKKLSINCYHTKTGEPLAVCIVRERHLKLIHDGELSDRKHEYNLFRRYSTIYSKQVKDGEFIQSRTELACAENCVCKCCYPPQQINTSYKYTINDVFRDGFDGDIDAWNHANQ